MGSDLNEESAQIRDVYAHYGLAIYLAQCLEHGIVLALVCAKLFPQERSQAKAAGKLSVVEFERRFDVFMDEQFELTMGGLISHLRTASTLPADFDVELTKAKELRNFLAHRYFRERAEDFISKVGRMSMLAELQEAQRLFEHVDEKLKIAADNFARNAGVALLRKEERVAEYKAKAYARAAARDAAEQE